MSNESHQWVFRNEPVQSRAPIISEIEWERHKGDICREFRQNGLHNMMRWMESNHQFHATERQYKYRLYHKWFVHRDTLKPTNTNELHNTPLPSYNINIGWEEDFPLPTTPQSDSVSTSFPTPSASPDTPPSSRYIPSTKNANAINENTATNDAIVPWVPNVEQRENEIPLPGEIPFPPPHVTYPASWESAPNQVRMKKRALRVFNGRKRLHKEDMIMNLDFEVLVPFDSGSYNVSDLDIQTLKRAEMILATAEDVRQP